MKRTKKWWASLTKDERSRLVWLEGLGKRVTLSNYLPEGSVECGGCGEPMMYGAGPCAYCRKEKDDIIKKANKLTYGKEA